jgi:hypothetical protein
MSNSFCPKITFWKGIRYYGIDFILDRSIGGTVFGNMCDCKKENICYRQKLVEKHYRSYFKTNAETEEYYC